MKKIVKINQKSRKNIEKYVKVELQYEKFVKIDQNSQKMLKNV